MQLINLYFKGKLKKVKGQTKRKNKIYLKNEKNIENYLHYGNGIEKIGSGLLVLHKSHDNEIESIIHRNKNYLNNVRL